MRSCEYGQPVADSLGYVFFRGRSRLSSAQTLEASAFLKVGETSSSTFGLTPRGKYRLCQAFERLNEYTERRVKQLAYGCQSLA